MLVTSLIWEHNLKLNDKWGNYMTCVKEDEPCPICTRGHQPTFTAYFTVIDTREFTRADGTKVKNRKVLYPAKKTQIKKLNDIIKKHNGDIRGKAFEVARYDAKESNSGSSFDYLRDVDISQLEDSTPFDYEKVLKPYTREELAGLGLASPPALGEIPKTEGEEKKTEELDLF